MHPDEVAVPGEELSDVVCDVLGLAFSLLCIEGQCWLKKLVLINRLEEELTDIVALTDVDVRELIPDTRSVFHKACDWRMVHQTQLSVDILMLLRVGKDIPLEQHC